MAPKTMIVALGLAAAAPAYATGDDRMATAPAGTPDTQYCMRVEAVTGSRLEHVQCWTRAQWADEGVDVDRDWATEGVRTVG